MDDAKDKMKGFMKNLTTSKSKFKGQGRVLGSSSPSSSSSSTTYSSPTNSRLLNPNPNTNPNPRPKPNPNPNPKPSAEFSPLEPLVTTGNRSAAAVSPAAEFNCPICSSPFPSESAVSDHVDLCLASANPDATATTKTSTIVAESVSFYLSNQPARDSVEVVLKLLSNLTREPGNEKFRRIRMGNPKIKEAVGDVKGGVELLESVGFKMSAEEGGGGGRRRGEGEEVGRRGRGRRRKRKREEEGGGGRGGGPEGGRGRRRRSAGGEGEEEEEGEEGGRR